MGCVTTIAFAWLALGLAATLPGCRYASLEEARAWLESVMEGQSK